ncbi:NACHT, LRR and PYD domains-containing protein 1a-like isoform X2 [Chelonoidis abingdonii]|uniref:NACHT, LRR and PYD domains-containing protein 1a-like isoform X2 n=1 Tax=Chelonoidis abingdonii TaxID=106734 RepID=UPI003F49A5A7
MEHGPTQSSAAAGRARGTIFISDWKGRVNVLDVCWEDTGVDLKRRVIQKISLYSDVDWFRLIFAGKELEDARSLQHQGLTNHCTVYLMLNKRSGGDPSFLPPGEARKAVAAFRYSAMLKGKCKRCVGEILPEITPEIVAGTEENRTIYRARIPSAGFFHCSETGLGFEVSTAVTVEYEYSSWAESLSPSARQEWMVAGPLFHIRAEPDTVRAVHLPHFVCLADGTDESLCCIAHFEAGCMTLESPSRINNYFAVLKNPSFSQLGVLWRKIRSTIKFIPIQSLMLIFRTLSAADVTLHLYLIPNDHSLRKAIEEEEMKWKSKHVPKPPQTDPLYIGSQYQVSGPSDLEITPMQLHFCYRSPGEQQSYIEIYTKELEKEIRLHVNGQDDGNLVWEALVRPGRISRL